MLENQPGEESAPRRGGERSAGKGHGGKGRGGKPQRQSSGGDSQ